MLLEVWGWEGESIQKVNSFKLSDSDVKRDDSVLRQNVIMELNHLFSIVHPLGWWKWAENVSPSIDETGSIETRFDGVRGMGNGSD